MKRLSIHGRVYSLVVATKVKPPPQLSSQSSVVSVCGCVVSYGANAVCHSLCLYCGHWPVCVLLLGRYWLGWVAVLGCDVGRGILSVWWILSGHGNRGHCNARHNRASEDEGLYHRHKKQSPYYYTHSQ